MTWFKKIVCRLPFVIMIAWSCCFIVSCNKTTDTTSTNNNNNNNNNNNTNSNPDTPGSVAPKIKFFNVMDLGNTRLKVQLNNSTTNTIAKYYPSSSYIQTNYGSNFINVFYPDTTSTSVLNQYVDLTSNNYYSCFFYRVGYDWKYNLVKDDLTPLTDATKAGVRLLDFRTQAYFDYVRVRLYGPDDLTWYYSNFLKHSSFSGNTKFSAATPGTYRINIANDTLPNLYNGNVPFNLEAGKFYTIMLMTPSTLTSKNAIYYIYPDVKPNN